MVAGLWLTRRAARTDRTRASIILWGTWLVVTTTDSSSMKSLCDAGGTSDGFNVLTPGTHTMQVLDSTGKVLAQGSYTVNR